ncbi:ABC transporter substrate-binding protein [Bradyrhizobium sp. CB82]|uniref:ABC transporter substrate-binding protein n=1 Tax=Bradyrhizobium sp. CB82 TaxID=3039159 RepID=UPI0024B19F59|nr:ABC transporter substrate-binding protein [Bradyrhizobium sp. CB82]WFU44617.1 ABC transporter substrate-binding protein [Bradyrhizobium sp. CB82]
MNKCFVGMVIAWLGMTTVVAAELPERIKAAGKVIVATQPVYPPMEYKDPGTGELKGADIDLGRALAKQLGVEVVWTETAFEQMISAVTTGRVDVIHSGMADTPKRRESLDFVDYMKSGPQFYSVVSRKNEFKTPVDLCGKTIGMSRVTLFPDQAIKWSAQNCEKSGRPPIVIFGTQSSADARTQLRQGRVDAVVQGSETLPFIMNQEKDTYFLIGEPFADVYQGIGFARSEVSVRDAYAAALKVLMENGEYRKILASQGIEAMALDAVYMNGERVR